MNKVILKGKLVRDNQFKVSDKGTAFLTNSISITEGKDKKRTDYFNIVAFNEIAEAIANDFKKDNEIYFEGKLQNNNYEKDGKKVYRDQIVVTKLLAVTSSEITKSLLKSLDEEFPF